MLPDLLRPWALVALTSAAASSASVAPRPGASEAGPGRKDEDPSLRGHLAGNDEGGGGRRGAEGGMRGWVGRKLDWLFLDRVVPNGDFYEYHSLEPTTYPPTVSPAPTPSPPPVAGGVAWTIAATDDAADDYSSRVSPSPSPSVVVYTPPDFFRATDRCYDSHTQTFIHSNCATLASHSALDCAAISPNSIDPEVAGLAEEYGPAKLCLTRLPFPDDLESWYVLNAGCIPEWETCLYCTCGNFTSASDSLDIYTDPDAKCEFDPLLWADDDMLHVTGCDHDDLKKVTMFTGFMSFHPMTGDMDFDDLGWEYEATDAQEVTWREGVDEETGEVVKTEAVETEAVEAATIVEEGKDVNVTFYLMADGRLRNVNATKKKLGELEPEGHEFLVHLGSAVHPDDNCAREAYQDASHALSASPVTVYSLPGNADYPACKNTHEGRKYYDTSLSEIDTLHWNDPQNYVVQRDIARRENFAWLYGRILFVGLNTVTNDAANETVKRLEDDKNWLISQYYARLDSVDIIFAMGHSKLLDEENAPLLDAIKLIKELERKDLLFVYARPGGTTTEAHRNVDGVEGLVEMGVGKGWPVTEVTVGIANGRKFVGVYEKSR